jgi:phosphatidylserine decarboxylase
MIITNFISSIAGLFSQLNLPAWILIPLIRVFIKKYRIIKEDIELPLDNFRNFDSFFTRSLKPESRPVDTNKESIVSPVDAQVKNLAEMQEKTLIQAKGIKYRLDELIPFTFANEFTEGKYCNFYLSPADCHRIFAPCDGQIIGIAHVPGKLLPVCEPYVNQKKNLYIQNERLIIYLKTKYGLIAMVNVGALNVGSISVDFKIDKPMKFKRDKLQEIIFPKPITVKKAQHISTFHLGSTVILLLPNTIEFAQEIAHKKILYGQKIANW